MAIQERNSEMVNLLSPDFIRKTDTTFLQGIYTGLLLGISGLQGYWSMGVSQNDDGDVLNNYLYLPGRAGGQVANGGTAAGEDLTLSSTANATKGNIYIGQAWWDEVNQVLWIGNFSGDYIPDILTWASGGTNLILTGEPHSSIGFHNPGNRVDFIVAGEGIISVGYDGGSGVAETQSPGGVDVTGVIHAYTTSNWRRAVKLPESAVIMWSKGSGNISRAIGLTSDDGWYFMRSASDDDSSAAVYDMFMDGTGNLYLGASGGFVNFGGRIGEAWTNVTYNTGWGNYSTGHHPISYKKVGDLVYLRGVAVRTSGSDPVICTLPSGYRPNLSVIFPATSNYAYCSIDITSGGVVTLVGGSPTLWVAIDGIVFSTL